MSAVSAITTTATAVGQSQIFTISDGVASTNATLTPPCRRRRIKVSFFSYPEINISVCKLALDTDFYLHFSKNK